MVPFYIKYSNFLNKKGGGVCVCVQVQKEFIINNHIQGTKEEVIEVPLASNYSLCKYPRSPPFFFSLSAHTHTHTHTHHAHTITKLTLKKKDLLKPILDHKMHIKFLPKIIFVSVRSYIFTSEAFCLF